MSTDRLSNMLSAIKNAAMAKKPVIEMWHSIECENVAKIFKEKGYLDEVKVFKPKGKAYKRITLKLAHDGDEYAINEVKRISKPGKRVYTSSAKLKIPSGGYGLTIVTTSRGVMDSKEAKKKKLGGEVLCEVF